MCLSLKRRCHELDISFDCLSILISPFCVCADGFQGPSKAFYTVLYNYNLFLLSVLKLVTNSEFIALSPLYRYIISHLISINEEGCPECEVRKARMGSGRVMG